MSVVTGPDNQREEKISSLVRLYEKDLLRTCCVYLRDSGGQVRLDRSGGGGGRDPQRR